MGNNILVIGNGYDHNYILTIPEGEIPLVASAYDPKSGRKLQVYTDRPGVQLYTACTTDYEGGRGGVHYGNYSGLCLETQHFPDSPNHVHFPSTVLRPGEKYDTTTIYAFRVDTDGEA